MTNKLSHHLFGTLRQWCFPVEFRVDPPLKDEGQEQLDSLVCSLNDMIQRLATPLTPIDPVLPSSLDDEPFIADLATRLWRVRQSLMQTGSNDPVAGADRGFRHLDRLLATLEQEGIRIVDRTGSFYDPGMAMQVVSSEPMDGIGREVIKETIKPAIYRGERLIQTPQVVVGTPSRRDDGIGT
jgi:hypothetical protein